MLHAFSVLLCLQLVKLVRCYVPLWVAIGSVAGRHFVSGSCLAWECNNDVSYVEHSKHVNCSNVPKVDLCHLWKREQKEQVRVNLSVSVAKSAEGNHPPEYNNIDNYYRMIPSDNLDYFVCADGDGYDRFSWRLLPSPSGWKKPALVEIISCNTSAIRFRGGSENFQEEFLPSLSRASGLFLNVRKYAALLFSKYIL